MSRTSPSRCAAPWTGAVLAVALVGFALLSPSAGAMTARTPPRRAAAPTGSTVPAPAAPPLSWIVVDMDTGRVLVQHEAHVLRRPASTIKLLTVLTAQAHLRPDATVPVSAYAATMPALRIGLLPGEVWPLSQLISSSIIVSANDAAVAIAEASGGSLDGFQAQMEDMTRRLHMVDSPHLTDPAGLDDQVYHGTGDFISAWDLALVGRAALADPTIVDAARTPVAHFTDPQGKARRLVNHNHLLAKYPGATGLKTGYTLAAGHTIIATATRDGRTIMAVALNAPNLYGSVTDLLNVGFSIPVAAETGEPLVAPIVETAVKDTVVPRVTRSARPSLVVLALVAGAAALVAALVVRVARRRGLMRRRGARPVTRSPRPPPPPAAGERILERR